MSIELAEQLKRDLTDKWVIVADAVPELRRFADLSGRVKTVNMNGRALVEFVAEDIGWYDIDPQFLTVVDGPITKPKPAAEAKAAPAKPAKPVAAGNPAGAAAGASPLDAIRAAAGAKAPAKADAAPKASSPLDQIRAGAGGAKAKDAAEEKPAAGASPLDQIRAKGGFKG